MVIIKRVDAAKIDSTDIGCGAAVVMRHDPAFRAEMVRCNPGVPFISHNIFIASFNTYPVTRTGQHNRPAPFAQAAITSPDRCQINVAWDRKLHTATVTFAIEPITVH